MRRRTLIVVTFLVAIACAAFFIAPAITRGTGADLRQEEVAQAWPVDRAAAWSFKLPRDRSELSRLSLRIRTKTSTLPPDITLAIPVQSSAMPASEADREFGAGGGEIELSRAADEGRAIVQLLDLSRIGAVSVKPNQDLRLLASLRLGGLSMDMAPEDTILPPGKFAGSNFQQSGEWAHDELYLASCYVQDDRKIWKCDVFVKHSRDGIGR